MAAGLQAGAGRRVIEIPREYLAVENFGLIHDPIHARAVAIRSEETILLVSLEITSMPGEETEAVRSLIAEKTGVKETNIWVCVTHSFSSPHLLPDHMMKSEKELALKKEYREALQSAAVGAAADQAPIEKAVNEIFEHGGTIRTDLPHGGGHHGTVRI